MSVKLKSLNGSEFKTKWWTFPGGERGVKILEWQGVSLNETVQIECIFKSSNDLIDILLLNDAIKEQRQETEVELYIPYFPYARQDRVMESGESFSLRVAVQMLKTCNFKNIVVVDPHSDVLSGMFGPGELITISQATACYYKLTEAGVGKPNTYLISPDAGALKKIYKAAKAFSVPVIEARKVRDVSTGQITSTSVEKIEVVGNPTFIILDDICDGGKTFIELAKEIRREYGECTIKLVVTHGIFSKGLDVLYEQIDEVYAAYRLDEVEKT